MAKLPKVDVVTFGAGWTAGILAQQLTKVGLQVVSLEQGPLARPTATSVTITTSCATRSAAT